MQRWGDWESSFGSYVHCPSINDVLEKDQRLLSGMCSSYYYKPWSASICAQKFPVEDFDYSGSVVFHEMT